MKTELTHIALGDIKPSKTNPRKDFTSPAAKTYLAEIASTIRDRGVKQPAVVRPDYCIGTHTQAEIVAARREPKFYELIFGECRWRASAIAEKTTLPCLPEESTDDDAREVQQIENLQRRDLTALEEAAGYEDMLSLLSPDGKTKRYTVETLALKIGREPAYIYQRRTLVLLPKLAREGMESGALPLRTAAIIASVPDPKLREEFARRVLKPQYEVGPLSYRDALKLKQEEFVVSLKGAPFKLEDADLVKAAGACIGCPKMSANCANLMNDDEKNAHLKGRSCFDPTCFKSKLAALRVVAIAAAKEKGLELLDKVECEKIFPRHWPAGHMSHGCTFVYLSKQPEEWRLKKGSKRVGSWKALLEAAEQKTGGKVPRVLAEDQDGTLHELVDSKLAIALIEKSADVVDTAFVLELVEKSADVSGKELVAKEITAAGKAVGVEFAAKKVATLFDKSDAKKAVEKIMGEAGESIFAKSEPRSSGSGGGGSSASQKAEQAAAKLRFAVSLAGLTMLHAKLVKAWVVSPLWEAMWDNAMWHAGCDGQWIICKWQKLDMGDHGTEKDKAVTTWAKGLTAAERQALVPLLLVSTSLKHNGVKTSGFTDLAESVKLDVKDIEKQGASDLKTAKAAKNKVKVKPAKDAASKAVAAVKGGKKK